MDYQEFRKLVGELIIPDKDLSDRLVRAENSIHFVVCLGVISGEDYKINISEENMNLFLDFLNMLEARGAKRDLDYFVGGEKSEIAITLGIHTTTAFFSDEDADPSIKVIHTK